MSESAAQRSEQWKLERAGKLTASVFADVIATTRKGEPTAEYNKLLRLKAFERLAGIPRHEMNGKALAWGSDLEEAAVEAYEIETGNIVEPSGFVLHPDYEFIGCSPDGLVGEHGGIEIKCPHDEQIHIQTWLDGMCSGHMAQVQGNMLVTGRLWWDFISYDPRQAPELRLYIQRIPRDEAYCQKLRAALLEFEDKLGEMVNTLRKKAA